MASVLVVDDDLGALASACTALSAAGHRVQEALSGRRALQRIAAGPPDILITKILMPEGDGIELIATVKRAHPDIRIIAFSDRVFLGSLDLLNLASQLGADAALVARLGSDNLLATVARLLG